MRRGIVRRFAAALICAAGAACLLRAAAPAAGNTPQGSERAMERAAAAAGARGVRIVQHGSYPELRVDDKPFFINSAAFFYARIPRNLWGASLDRYRELGINTIELSIPWNWHELREGDFDFDGHSNPRRDLRGLLQLVAEKGFKLIARPGPTIFREWRNAGYPDWLLESPVYHMPLADRMEGLPPPAVERTETDAEGGAQSWLNNPVHMTYTERWLQAVARELTAFRADATVRVADREISGPLLFVQLDEGLGGGTASTAGPASWSYAEALCGMLSRSGLDAFCFVDSAEPRAAAAGSALHPPVAATGDWFGGRRNETGAEESQFSPVDVAELELVAASLATQPAFPPLLAEFNAGWFAPDDDPRPPPGAPEDITLSTHLLVGDGLRGLNWFPLQDTLTPAGFGTPEANRFYRWDAALSLNGSRQPGAREVARIGEWLQVWGSELAASHPRADFGLVDTLAALPRERVSRADAASVTTTLAQLQRLAQYSGMSPELVDPEYQPAEQLLRYALILLPVYKPEDPAFALSEKAQRALEAYVRGGGVLVCFPGRPAGAVFEALQKGPVTEPTPLPLGSTAWRAGSGRFVVLTKDFYSWVSLHEEFAEGWKRVEAPLARSLLESLLQEAGERPCVHRNLSKPEESGLVVTELVSNEGTLPLGERSGGQGWLSVVNLSHDSPASETLRVLSPRASARSDKNAPGEWIEVPVTVPPRESLLLPLDLSLCLEPEQRAGCDDRVVSAGAELVRAEREGKAMFLTFYAPAKASVRLHLPERPEHFEVDEVRADAQWLPKSHELVVDLLRGASPRYLRVLRVPVSYRPGLPERPKLDGRHPPPAHFRFSPAGAVRLPLGEDTALLSNPPLYVFNRGSEGALWVLADNLGGQGGDVQVTATGQFNTSARAYVNGNELRTLNLKIPTSTVEKAAAASPGADGLYHGSLHFAAGAESLDVPLSFAILPAHEAVGYQFDFDAGGSPDRVLENSALRAIFSPADGGRMVALVLKAEDRSLASTMGLLEDVFTFTPNPPGTPPRSARGRSGTFNRTYAADWVPGDGGPALRLSYEAPDVYPHGARIEKIARFAGERTLSVEYHVSLLAADDRRLQEEAAGRIFAAPMPAEPVPQSFEILNSIAAETNGTKSTEFCWSVPEAASQRGGAAEHCEAFVPGGPVVSLPAGVSRLEIRQARHPGLLIGWADTKARLTLEPKNYSVLLRLVFPPLDAGGAAASYRIEFSVKESP
jgi:hypothetical protein